MFKHIFWVFFFMWEELFSPLTTFYHISVKFDFCVKMKEAENVTAGNTLTPRYRAIYNDNVNKLTASGGQEKCKIIK